MAVSFPTQARAVVVGGGVVGCSVAYHLTKVGWSDVVLLERKTLTSGTTWHAAGLIGQLRATSNMTNLAKYTADLLFKLEDETGQSTGFIQCGSLAVAPHQERFEELKRGGSMASNLGLEAVVLTPAECKEMWPLCNVEDIVGGLFLPKDGRGSPTDITQAFAKGAKMGGAKIFENTKVTGVKQKDGRVTGVSTDKGDMACEVVVNCAGMWGREFGRMAGVAVPLHAAEHFYIVTETMEGMEKNLPVLRDPSSCIYCKDETGKLMIGCFEPVAKPWGMEGIPEDFEFGQLPDDWEHFEPILEGAMHRIPALKEVGIQLFFNGPESFTPDDRYQLGEAPELKGFFHACGFNSVGLQSAGGAGKVLSEWIAEGYPPIDLWDVDIRRMMPFQNNARYLHDRTVEGLGLLYAMHWPFRQFESARPVRMSPLHDRLVAAGACMGEMAGWERANWFAPQGVQPKYEYSFGRQNWFDHSAAEHFAVREAVGLFEQTSFGKFLVQGDDAERVLGRICANDVSKDPGRVVYTQWLNERGGIETDLTVTRLDEDRYLVVTAGASQTRDFHWLVDHIPEGAHATATDVTSAYAVLSVMGPNSRHLLSGLTDAELSNDAFPFFTAREIDLAYARVWALRATYVGELGWELYIPTEFAVPVYDAIVAEGGDFGLKHAGYHALNSLRIEKGYKHWGHDITDEDTPLEAGLGFAVDFAKKGGFIGKEALLAQKEKPLTRRLASFAMESPEPLLYHNEPIWRDGQRVGYITSGMFGHTVGRAIGMGYVENDSGVDRAFVEAGSYEIEVAGQRLAARASLKAFYDPKHQRLRT